MDLVGHNGVVTDWLKVPDLVEILNSTPSRIRRLINERYLPATRIDGVLAVPAEFLRDGEVLPELHGTAVMLSDWGFTDDQIVAWLLEPEESLGASPIDALRAGRRSEVRRLAQALA